MGYYKHTFLNGSEDLRDTGLKSLESVKQDLAFWAENGTDPECYDGEDQEIMDRFDDLGSFHEYGLCFDFVEPDFDADEPTEGYFRYQLSWGGPSTEIRFYPDHTEFVYLDWFVGVGFDVTKDPDFAWVKDYFSDCDMLDFSKAGY